ncbi:unnamed protein product [Didymodactylos carnosus]|uniref:Nudix hydrolase domain-containing protein n=1 Tax=Didymodactylos carnosus TaxID=1234261 RepID=A0A8S2DUV7_9BILA|nr:unnamed protein product [Didymodactylos carnosus]CAF3807611.1 unnamed protein product [Didymodactylos carnosus]
MSDNKLASNQYTCVQCTFINSKLVPHCEICQFENEYFTPQATASNSDYILPPGCIACPQCTTINLVDDDYCEMCESRLNRGTSGNKRIRYDYDYDNDKKSDEIDREPTVTAKPPMPLIEKSMDDHQIKLYYEQHQWVMNQYQIIKNSKIKNSPIPSIDIKNVHDLIEQLYSSNEYKPDLCQPLGQLIFDSCQICFDSPHDSPILEMSTCQHRMICRDCFQQYLSIRIRDSEVMPWLPCPAEICPIPLSCKNILEDGGLKIEELLLFCQIYMNKKLNRNENFIQCKTHDCFGGFLQFGKPRSEQVTCQICQQVQKIEKGKDGELDSEFQDMIKKGALRECPSCKHLTMKEKGLCNVIECAKCSIWWNWATREMGQDGRDLKHRARYNGSLWEPGELEYQQNLQYRNPAEFKALLERNGIEYDPNYFITFKMSENINDLASDYVADSSSSLTVDPISAPMASGDTTQDDSLKDDTSAVKNDPSKVVFLLKPAGGAPILKKKKWALPRTKTMGHIVEFLKKYMKLDQSAATLFLYVNQAFSPALDTTLGAILLYNRLFVRDLTMSTAFTLDILKERLNPYLDKEEHFQQLQKCYPKLNRLRRASVLIPLFYDKNTHEIQVLLTKRAETVRSHTGMIAFPGGMRDSTDRDDIHTAEREAEEEIGIKSDQYEILGKLIPLTDSRLVIIAPVIAYLSTKFENYQLSVDETTDAFYINLSEFLSSKNHQSSVVELDKRRSFILHHFNFETKHIWGVTAYQLILLAAMIYQRVPEFQVFAEFPIDLKQLVNQQKFNLNKSIEKFAQIEQNKTNEYISSHL